jgi:RNA polymerase sigma factor (sigma-70 family)
MNDDAALLRRYAEDRSEGAFAELVRRHLDLVYGAAMRRTGGDPHRSSDISQQVFASLARHARRLSRHAVLEAWLHTATRNASLNLMISEERRRIREAEAAAGAESSGGPGDSPDWQGIQQVLDAAIDELPGPDREAVVLRYLEHRGFAEIGVALRISADAARMRTGRALDRLRLLLARRGISSTAEALGSLITSHALVRAPAGLAARLAAASLFAPGIGTAATLTTLMTTKTIGVAIIAGVLAFGAGRYVGRTGGQDAGGQPPPENPGQSRTIDALRKSNAVLQSEIDRVDSANLQLTAANAQLTSANAKLAAKAASPAPSRNLSIGMTTRELKQNILSNLRQLDAARSQYKLENGRDPDSVETLVGDNGYIRRLRTVGGEDYSGLSMAAGGLLTVTTPDGTTITYDPNGIATTQITEPPTEDEKAQELAASVAPAVNQAVAAYKAANQGQNPPTPEALTPYFTNPQDAVTFAQAREAMKAAHPPH